MNCREEISIRLTSMGNSPKVRQLFSRFCKGHWAGDACCLYRSMRIENDWSVAIEWSRVKDPETMKAQREWLIWALEDLGHVYCTFWQDEEPSGT